MTKNQFPAVLWLLPIVFGILGGTVAAVIASLKYQAEWWRLFMVGIMISLLGMLGYALIWATMINTIYRY